jgi:hypothetical protein
MTLGPGHTDPIEEQALTDYLGQLVSRRDAPVHVAVAFNAAFFGYDLSECAYVGGPLELDDFPHVAFKETTDALPVGAMVAVTTGATPLYAEVVYKEGAHHSLGNDGHVPPWLSGAPANATGPGHIDDTLTEPILTERLVCDFDAFGQDFTVTRARLDAWRIRGKYINTAGHLLLRSRYTSIDQAQLDDVAFYAEYLLGAVRDRLLSFVAPQPLLSMLTNTAGPQQIDAAVRGLLRTVAHALSRAPGVRMWRSYAFSTDSLARRLADPGVLGGADLIGGARTLGRAPVTRSTRFAPAAPTISYTAVAPRLGQVESASAELSGTRYPLTICHVNTVIADYLAAHAVDAVLPTGVSVSLDDDWQGGGVWRTEHPASPQSGIDMLAASGLGWASTLPQTDPEEPEADDHNEPDDEPPVAITDSQISWVVPARLAHLVEGRSPLPQQVAGLIACGGAQPGRTLRLTLIHEGVELAAEEATQDGVGVHGSVTQAGGRPQLAPLTWPLELYPAVKVTFVLPISALGSSAGSVITAFTTRLAVPVDIDGIVYDHEFDPHVLTRDTAPGSPDRRGRAPRPLSLADRIVRAVRTQGWLHDDGTAILETSDLPAAVHGKAADELPTALIALVGAGTLRIARLVRTPDGLRYPPVSGQIGTVEVITWTPPGSAGDGPKMLPPRLPEPPVLHGYVTTQDVRWFLRRIRGTPSREAEQAWAAQLRRSGRPFRPLPPGFTYVREHRRRRLW